MDRGKFMAQSFIKILGVVGGGAVVFYTFGFIVVQSYIHSIGLEGMFWFTEDFYEDAGAKFFLTLIGTSLLAFYMFLPFLVGLFFLLPKEKDIPPTGPLEDVLKERAFLKPNHVLNWQHERG